MFYHANKIIGVCLFNEIEAYFMQQFLTRYLLNFTFKIFKNNYQTGAQKKGISCYQPEIVGWFFKRFGAKATTTDFQSAYPCAGMQADEDY